MSFCFRHAVIRHHDLVLLNSRRLLAGQRASDELQLPVSRLNRPISAHS